MYIAIEGPDGSGKSTQVKLLSEKLTYLGYDNKVIREPGETGVGTKIRNMLMADDVAINQTTELLLFMANRAQITSEILQHKDAGNKIIISDRCFVSSIVYQYAVGKMKYDDSCMTSIEAVSELERVIKHYLGLHHTLKLAVPDLIIFLKYHDCNILEANLKARNEGNKFDGLNVNVFYNDVSEYLRDYIHTFNTVVIDCDELGSKQLSGEEISKKVFKAVMKYHTDPDDITF